MNDSSHLSQLVLKSGSFSLCHTDSYIFFSCQIQSCLLSFLVKRLLFIQFHSFAHLSFSLSFFLFFFESSLIPLYS